MAVPTIVAVAEVSTSNFEFTAYGKTKEEARACLLDGLRRHARKYGLRGQFWRDEDIRVNEVATGECFRSWQKI